MPTMPAYYVPHGGGPCFFMDWNPPDAWTELGAWLRSIPAQLPRRPKAQLVISAHWEAPRFTLLTTPAPELYYDYYDFPPHTYALQWPAPAAPELFGRVRSLVRGAGIALDEDDRRGFDHGVFIPGLLSFPQADLPTLQISLRQGLDPEEHLALGRALAPLRNEDVLLVGSGMSFHNMRAFRYGDNAPIPGADDFDQWLTESVRDLPPQERNRRLARWKEAPGARFAHPREEHLLPLMVLAGAAGPGSLAFHGRAMGAPLAGFALE
ncbi:DODA-type extradiol aromatic ring-opening family dioxygenase [Desulfovibrio legallii]|uniref:Aromatic ring-opening dioxygenase, catalytic subunit, LigB family n=1 Tax=Desulfovibrio legallii TaxID=571438 RepID=A0A1G7M8P1_9BACT|nr:class III extradiol ring-cleavage dioxygenase [Desulfovibrio legallii]SDF58102.1 Aromatic ring-opening dioxygenase, catalytic subunit, LigB family [Desulfovibrio legallii]